MIETMSHYHYALVRKTGEYRLSWKEQSGIVVKSAQGQTDFMQYCDQQIRRRS